MYTKRCSLNGLKLSGRIIIIRNTFFLRLEAHCSTNIPRLLIERREHFSTQRISKKEKTQSLCWKSVHQNINLEDTGLPLSLKMSNFVSPYAWISDNGVPF
ncbi:unnamed protein product [Lepeophtheirus salmonis]|uniref:(salmon louse) hypothetical protein n=1 Tax=Lepeophtheirus salmonis TaxID=72036 RepID=A0A7R8H0J9_LEPSM|nr:unnamed protein product [Lepeophtheirus salmonis]CAF2792632.1 unnamed protein product [Lepeophtheirus salmonis]